MVLPWVTPAKAEQRESRECWDASPEKEVDVLALGLFCTQCIDRKIMPSFQTAPRKQSANRAEKDGEGHVKRPIREAGHEACARAVSKVRVRESGVRK